MVQRNCVQVKRDIQDLIGSELDWINNDPALAKLILKNDRQMKATHLSYRRFLYVRICACSRQHF
jgi:hypothetical protein